MPFSCALVFLELHHAPVSVSKLTNPHSTLDDRSLVCSMPQDLSSNYHNPAYNVFNPKFSRLFHNKPNQIPPLGNSISSDLCAVGFKKKSVVQPITIATPAWLLNRPVVDFRLRCSEKDTTPPDIFTNCYNQLCHNYHNHYRIYRNGSKTSYRVGAAVCHRNKTKYVRLPNTASIFRAELYALLLAIDVRRSKEKNFIIFSDSMSSLQAINGFKIELDLVQRFMKDYSALSKSSESIVL